MSLHNWIEVQAPDEKTHRLIFRMADKHHCGSIHHFQEPWFEDGYVVRILIDPKRQDAFLKDVGDVTWTQWDATPDENLFGAMWPYVRNMFEASSRISLEIGDTQDPGWYARKIIHCTLNSWGLGAGQEAAFAKSLLNERKKTLRHWRWWNLRQRIRPGTCKWGCHRPEWT